MTGATPRGLTVVLADADSTPACARTSALSSRITSLSHLCRPVVVRDAERSGLPTARGLPPLSRRTTLCEVQGEQGPSQPFQRGHSGGPRVPLTLREDRGRPAE